jgi:hypothetical protein
MDIYTGALVKKFKQMKDEKYKLISLDGQEDFVYTLTPNYELVRWGVETQKVMRRFDNLANVGQINSMVFYS